MDPKQIAMEHAAHASAELWQTGAIGAMCVILMIFVGALVLWAAPKVQQDFHRELKEERESWTGRFEKQREDFLRALEEERDKRETWHLVLVQELKALALAINDLARHK